MKYLYAMEEIEGKLNKGEMVEIKDIKEEY